MTLLGNCVEKWRMLVCWENMVPTSGRMLRFIFVFLRDLVVVVLIFLRQVLLCSPGFSWIPVLGCQMWDAMPSCHRGFHLRLTGRCLVGKEREWRRRGEKRWQSGLTVEAHWEKSEPRVLPGPVGKRRSKEGSPTLPCSWSGCNGAGQYSLRSCLSFLIL